MNIVDLVQKGGLAIWPLMVLSVLAIGTIFERLWFWSSILKDERKTAGQVLEASRRDWDEATHLARQVSNRPIGRFLHTPLRLANKEPEVFRLALEASADEELNAMRRGDKLLEAVIALSPLLGLLGTVLGLIGSLSSIRLGDIGSSSTSTVTLGISEALISTAFGLVVAIVSLAFYRLFQGLVTNQARIFRRTGNELELNYRQFWMQSQERKQESTPASTSMPSLFDE
ncbi:Biopolymer transport protein ExbB [Acaryochloris thomasi RCC1774]|uniref:Biopolymer transport protein ExbB n=1 Tax=Acaryochloris thomasi RCC1774 TaxID=1764569 RepID=A0A2W1JN48_9CYAN|nr:MotA/TolQ/ExbB proton channel family protein [Acaryochloris thomasi]PZD74748.1 Biopolymer transport protein ExbB [Acaryochloris thomasi RCC1774]